VPGQGGQGDGDAAPKIRPTHFLGHSLAKYESTTSRALLRSSEGIAGLYDMAVVGQPVQQRRSQLGIAKDAGPLGKDQVGGDHHAGVLYALSSLRELTPFSKFVKFMFLLIFCTFISASSGAAISNRCILWKVGIVTGASGGKRAINGCTGLGFDESSLL
jgi:hypothetical protein